MKIIEVSFKKNYGFNDIIEKCFFRDGNGHRFEVLFETFAEEVCLVEDCIGQVLYSDSTENKITLSSRKVLCVYFETGINKEKIAEQYIYPKKYDSRYFSAIFKIPDPVIKEVKWSINRCEELLTLKPRRPPPH